MDCDPQKLIALIEKRPAIYKYKLKEHNSRNFVESLWNEIAKETNCDVAECKSKWTSLRNSYARTLRQENNMKAESKRWYLADSMSFMRGYMRQHRTRDFSFDDAENICDETASSSSQRAPSPFEMPPVKRQKPTMDDPNPRTEIMQTHADDIQDDENLTVFKDLTPVTKNSGLHYKHAEGTPRIAIMQRTRSDDTQEEDENLTFFKGLLPDIKKLTPRNQRTLKRNMFQKLMDMLDEQEYDVEVENLITLQKQETDS